MIDIVNVGYNSTNYYVLGQSTTRLLIDLGWPGTLPKLAANLRRKDILLQHIRPRSTKGWAKRMSMPPNTWMPREQWDALVRGETCPVCQELQSAVPANQYGITITDLPMSRLRLASNQFVRGYCVLICKHHVQEPYHLPRTQYLQFFADMTLVGQALERVFQPLKMNFNLLGNAVPHLHAHILPRYYGDAAPHSPIDPNMETLELSSQEAQARAQAIAEALAMLVTTVA